MQVGTEILLARMKEYPEEFIIDEGDVIGRWERVMRDARNYLPEEDLKAIDEAYRQIHIDKFNERVLKVLAGEDTPEKETVVYNTKGRYATGWSDPRMLGQAQQAQNNMLGSATQIGSAYQNSMLGGNGGSGTVLMEGLAGIGAQDFWGGNK